MNELTPIGITILGNVVIKEAMSKDEKEGYRFLSASCKFRHYDPIEVNGQHLLENMSGRIEAYESKDEKIGSCGYGAAEIQYGKDVDGSAYSLFFIQLNRQTFDRLCEAARDLSRVNIEFGIEVYGVFFDQNKGIKRWLTSRSGTLGAVGSCTLVSRFKTE